MSLYKDLLPLYPADFSPDVLSTDHSGKLQVLARLLQAMHTGEVKERSVLVSNYTQVCILCAVMSQGISAITANYPIAFFSVI